MNNIPSFRCLCVDSYRDYAPLVLRVVTGAIFLVHGLDKLNQGLKGTASFLSSLGFPLALLLAVALIAVEVLGGLALIVGLYTHWAAKLTAIVAAVAFLAVHLENGFSVRDGGYEYIVLLFAASVSLVLSGGGKYALDSYLFEKKEKEQ